MKYIVYWYIAPMVVGVMHFSHRGNAVKFYNNNHHSWQQENRFTHAKNEIPYYFDSLKTGVQYPKAISGDGFLVVEAKGD